MIAITVTKNLRGNPEAQQDALKRCGTGAKEGDTLLLRGWNGFEGLFKKESDQYLKL